MKKAPGRPRLSDEVAAARAARIMDIAVALHNGQAARLRSTFGLSPAQAARVVCQRYRGKVGLFLGDSLRALAPGVNVTAAAVRLHLDHGLPVNACVRVFRDRVNVRDLRRAINAEKLKRSGTTAG